MDYTVRGILQARILEWVAFPFLKRSSQPRSPALQANSLPAEPQGKPKNTGVGNLSLLQRIFPTQKSNWGLLHCRRILYQLSYQGSPRWCWQAVISSWVNLSNGLGSHRQGAKASASVNLFRILQPKNLESICFYFRKHEDNNL